MAERLRESCVERANMAKALEAAMTPAGAAGPETRVALTPEQSKRVAEQTGVGVEVVTVRDTVARPWPQQMASVEPRGIEAPAARPGAAPRLTRETRERAGPGVRARERRGVPGVA